MHSKVHRNHDLVLRLGNNVRIFWETDKKYVGPYSVIRVDEKQVFIMVNEKCSTQYSSNIIS